MGRGQATVKDLFSVVIGEKRGKQGQENTLQETTSIRISLLREQEMIIDHLFTEGKPVSAGNIWRRVFSSSDFNMPEGRSITDVQDDMQFLMKAGLVREVKSITPSEPDMWALTDEAKRKGWDSGHGKFQR